MGGFEQPKTVAADDLPLLISPEDPTPAYLQLANQLQALIDSRTLRAGTKLPPSRALARALGINRNTIVAALERLNSLGLIEARGRAGTIVSELAVRTAGARSAADEPAAARLTAVPTSAVRAGSAPAVRTPPLRHRAGPSGTGASTGRSSRPRAAAATQPIDFRLGFADPTPLPLEVWRRACREAGRQLPGSDYGDPQGDLELRSQIALYLGRTRTMRVDPAQVIVTAGAGRAIERIAEVTVRRQDLVALEEPGYPQAAEIFRRCGGRLLPIPVDDDGINTDALPTEKRAVRLIHVTPSHQYPLGARLSSARRHTLIRWSRENSVLVIEDDYDGEFRYGGAPLPALASIAGFDQIAYVSTFSKVLSPAIRLGFAVTHTDLATSLAERIAQARDSVSIVTQRIVSWLIRSGELEKHIRRARKSYSARRASILGALSEVPQIESVTGQAAGLHVVIKLYAGISPRKLFPELKARGLIVNRVADFTLQQRSDDRLLMAYGHLSDSEILAGVSRLRAALREA
jgi:GntR family transcriptional regulator/MocR family aminotransferase